MKVLSYGKITPDRTECPNCKCVLEYLPADICYTYNNEEHVSYIVCPVCSYDITLHIEVL